METSNKFILKSFKSFNAGKFYQAEREFNSGLLRDIENNSFQEVEHYLNDVLPLLEKNSLTHESEQIIQYYLTHVKKHKSIENGFKPVTKFIISNLKSNKNPNCTLSFFIGFMEFLTNNQEIEIVEFMKSHYQDFLNSSREFTYHDEVEKRLFKTFIMISLFKEDELIANSIFLPDLDINKNLKYILYSLIIIAINGNISKSIKILQDLRKKVPIDIQKEFEIFQCCSEFLLASSSKDYDWITELQTHFADSLKEKTLKLLIMNLVKNIFPEESKISLFDLFK